ncbi:hypothetical protein TNCV_153321 [Trichonephila clavipes]|nr:hypothetical protein TNCV_153321 [Trichonephila clavipes]
MPNAVSLCQNTDMHLMYGNGRATLSKSTHVEEQNICDYIDSCAKIVHLSPVLIEEVDRRLYENHTWKKSSDHVDEIPSKSKRSVAYRLHITQLGMAI